MLVEMDLPLVGGGTEAGGLITTSEQLSGSEEKHLKLRMKQMICGSVNGMRIRQYLLQPYVPQTGMQGP